MRRTLISVCTCAVVLLGGNASAEGDGEWLGQARVILITGESRIVHKCTLGEKALTGLVTPGDPISIEKKYIDKVYRYVGNQSGEYAAMGFGCGAIVGLGLAMTSTKNDPGGRNYGKVIRMSALIGAAGLTVGAIVGLLIKDWERIPVAGRTWIEPATGTSSFILSFKF